jgi:hypothetical protein
VVVGGGWAAIRMHIDSCCVYYVAWLVGMVGLNGLLLCVLCGMVGRDSLGCYMFVDSCCV